MYKIISKAFNMNPHTSALFFPFGFFNPHLIESLKGSDNTSAYPDGVFSFSRGLRINIHSRRSQCYNFFFKPRLHFWKHSCSPS